jgi:hypothetical protein
VRHVVRSSAHVSRICYIVQITLDIPSEDNIFWYHCIIHELIKSILETSQIINEEVKTASSYQELATQKDSQITNNTKYRTFNLICNMFSFAKTILSLSVKKTQYTEKPSDTKT